MMHQITQEQVIQFLVEQQPPCISLYLPTHRRHPGNLRVQQLNVKIETKPEYATSGARD